jgi:hypothetical protein
MGGDLVGGKFYRWNSYAYNYNQLGMTGMDFYMTAITGGTVGLGDLALALHTAWAAIYPTMTPGTTTLLGSKVNIRNVAPAVPPLPGVVTDGQAGLAAGIAAPLVCSGIGSTFTLLSGRGYRGRMYFPFPASTNIAGNNQPTVGYQGNVVAAMNALLGVLTVTGSIGGGTAYITPVIYHRKTDTGTTITAVASRPAWANQHRRGSYGKPNLAVIPL